MVAIHDNMLAGDGMYDFVKEIKESKQMLAYRFNPEGQLLVLTDKDISNALERAKKRFVDIHNVELKYVVFPYSSDTKQVTRMRNIAEKAGLNTIVHNFYLTGDLSEAKSTIKNRIFSPDKESYIAKVEANKEEKADLLRALVKHAKEQNFTMTSFSQCIAQGEDDDDEGLANLANEDTSEEEDGLAEGKKERSKKKMVAKKGVLVNPTHIKGYKSWGKKSKKNSKKHNKKNRKTPGSNNGIKMQAKKDKGSGMEDPDKLVNPEKAEKSKAAEDGKTGAQSQQDQKDAGNGAFSIAAPSMTIAMAVAIGAIALL